MPGSAGTRGNHVNDIGGAGGGAVAFEAKNNFVLDGTIDTSGNQGRGDHTNYHYSCGGGGAGGSVYIKAESFAGSGSAKANGANGKYTSWRDDYRHHSGGGGGGRIAVQCTNTGSSTHTFTGTLQAYGGVGGYRYQGKETAIGGQGTVYEDCGNVKKRLTVDNNGIAPQLPSYITDKKNVSNHKDTIQEVQELKVTVGSNFSIGYGNAISETLYFNGQCEGSVEKLKEAMKLLRTYWTLSNHIEIQV